MMISAVSRLYRMVFCRGGYGVHSPFVFDLITNVIEEKCMYYCYGMFDGIRLQLRQEGRKIKCGNRELTVKQALRRFCFSARGYRLLFRLANRFHPKKILVTGSGLGMTPLCVTAYSKDADCIVFEPEPPVAVIARNMVKKYARSSINVYDKSSLPDMHCFDFVVWGTPDDFSLNTFENMLRYLTDESILIISGINGSRTGKKAWKEICAHSKVTVTIDLYSFGIVFFSSKLNRKTYKCISM
jgi:hypothetical protein